EMLRRLREIYEWKISPVVNQDDIKIVSNLFWSVNVDNTIREYIADIAEATRKIASVRLGGSPRAATALQTAAAAVALIAGRDYVAPYDVKRGASHVLAQRLLFAQGAVVESTKQAPVAHRPV